MRAGSLLVVAACSHAPRVSLPDPPDPDVELTPGRPWPVTARQDIVETLDGIAVHDPYRWLEAEDDPSVQRWIEAQDIYAREVLHAVPERTVLVDRVRELLYYDTKGAPLHRGRSVFYTRKHGDGDKPVVYVARADGGPETPLVDPNAWSDGGDKSLAGWWPSWDGTRIAYSVTQTGSDDTRTRILDVATGTDLADTIDGTRRSAMSWAPDGSGFYYTWTPAASRTLDDADRPAFAELRFHKVGTDGAFDTIIHPATHDADLALSGSISRDGRWLVASIQHGWSRTAIYFKDARDRAAPWRPLVTGIDASFEVAAWRDRFYVTTNDGATRAHVFQVDPAHPQRDAWREILKQTDATLEHAQLAGDHLVVTYLDHAMTRVEVHTLDGKLVRELALPAPGTVTAIASAPDDDAVYVAYTSFTEPQIIYKTSIKTGALDTWSRVALPYDATTIVADQVTYPSKDGTKISMFVIHGKDATRTGTAPTILYGYGGFAINQVPSFSASRAIWLERGGVYAIPNLRGGGEYGEDWHRAVMLEHKQTTIDDLVAAAEYLVHDGWTSPAHLAISGGSNGGLMAAAVVTQRPELVKAAVCAVPLADMLRYHKFGAGKAWVPEYGSADDPEMFPILHAYSPYRRAIDATPRAYPALLVDSTDHDDRVDPMHARKLVAAIQAVQTANLPVLLRIERNGSHGADLARAQIERAADQLAFLISQLR